MVSLYEIERYCNGLLEVETLEDYCPNGLQVDAGRESVRRVVSGVSASQALVDAAAVAGADLLLVHHGYFWKGEGQTLTGIKGRRVRTLIQAGISLLAYHLPLDAHPRFGNNRQLGELLDLDGAPLDPAEPLVWAAELGAPLAPDALAEQLHVALGRRPLHLPSGREGPLRRIGWCSGAAQGYMERSAAAGLDAFISGEVSEQTAHLARELGVHFYGAGHHATERAGVRALGEHLAGRFALEHRFIDIPNPV